MKETTELAGVEEGSISVKFPIKRRNLTHCVLETTPKAFHALRRLGRLVIE